MNLEELKKPDLPQDVALEFTRFACEHYAKAIMERTIEYFQMFTTEDFNKVMGKYTPLELATLIEDSDYFDYEKELHYIDRFGDLESVDVFELEPLEEEYFNTLSLQEKLEILKDANREAYDLIIKLKRKE